MTHNTILLTLLLLAGILLFTNLGNQYLWQDEAETACLAKNTLKYGFPRAFDGENTVNPRIGEHSHVGFGKDFAWLYHPWMQFYITAGSFFLFGISTFTARLPFALIGLFNLILLYFLALRITKIRFVAVCSVLLTALSVPYLLMMRQCRYYAPSVFFVLAALFFYSRFRESRSNGDLALTATALIALGYTVHGIFVPVYAAIGIHYMFFSFDKKTFPRVAAAGMFMLAAVFWWFLLSQSSGHIAVIAPDKIFGNLEFQIRMINKYIFPVMFFGAIYCIRAVWKRKIGIDLMSEEKQAISLIGLVVLVSIITFCFVEQRHLRYFVYFIPLLAMVQGLILLRLARRSKVLLAGFLAVSVITGTFNMGYPNFLLPKYIYEITHDYDGPIEGIVKFLEKNASKGDTVKIIYGDLPLIFYTGLKIDNSWVYDDEHMPRWIVFRRGWHEQLTNDYYTKVTKKYKEYVLAYPDILYENRPGDLGYHKFATDKEAPGVIVFGRK